MRDDSAGREADAERAWRETVERTLSMDDDCTQRAVGLTASRRAFTSDERPASNRTRWVLSGLVLVAIPLIVYSELTTPTGAVNYEGLGIGLVLMVAGGLAYL